MATLSASPSFAGALTAASQKTAPSTSAASSSRAEQVAKEFTSFVVGQFVQEMYANMKPDKNFGGGAGEETFKSLLVDEYGKIAARNGGFGLTETIKRDIIKLQEVKK